MAAISLIFNIGLNLALIPCYGIYGAAISSLISYSLRSVRIIIIYLKDTQIKIFEILIINHSEILSLIESSIYPIISSRTKDKNE